VLLVYLKTPVGPTRVAVMILLGPNNMWGILCLEEWQGQDGDGVQDVHHIIRGRGSEERAGVRW
jgi:hypothetical protein